METTKKVTIEYTQKEMKKKFKHFTIKKSTKQKEDSNEGQKAAIGHIEDK